MTWGVEENVIERFAGADIPEDKISFEKATYTFNLPGPPAELLAEFRTYYGPTMNAFEAAGPTAARPSCSTSWSPYSTNRTRPVTKLRPRFPRRTCASRSPHNPDSLVRARQHERYPRQNQSGTPLRSGGVRVLANCETRRFVG